MKDKVPLGVYLVPELIGKPVRCGVSNRVYIVRSIDHTRAYVQFEKDAICFSTPDKLKIACKNWNYHIKPCKGSVDHDGEYCSDCSVEYARQRRELDYDY